MRPARPLVVALAWIAASPAALADRSRLGEDADVLDPGDCEVELSRERSAVRGTATERGTALQLDCGVGWRSELAASFATTRSDGPRAQGVGVEAKTSLRDRSGDRVAWSLAYGAAAERGAGGSWRRSGQFVALEATYAIDNAWLLEVKLGAQRDRPSRSDSTLWSLAAERGLTGAFEARVEFAGDDRQRPLWTAGLRYEVWPDRALISVAYGVRSGPLRERRLGAGVTFEF